MLRNRQKAHLSITIFDSFASTKKPSSSGTKTSFTSDTIIICGCAKFACNTQDVTYRNFFCILFVLVVQERHDTVPLHCRNATLSYTSQNQLLQTRNSDLAFLKKETHKWKSERLSLVIICRELSAMTALRCLSTNLWLLTPAKYANSNQFRQRTSILWNIHWTVLSWQHGVQLG